MRPYRVAARAEADLAALWDYVAQQSEAAADRLVATLVERFPTLALFPGMGRLREELAPMLRSFPVGNYVIYYRPLEEGVEIVRVIHAARDIRSLLEENGFDGHEAE